MTSATLCISVCLFVARDIDMDMTHEVKVANLFHLVRDLEARQRHLVAPLQPLQHDVVQSARVTVADEQDAILFLEAVVVVPEPQPVVEERALRGHERVVPRRRSLGSLR